MRLAARRLHLFPAARCNETDSPNTRVSAPLPYNAGWASAQISPDGHVWTCTIRAKGVGSLRDNEYDFQRIWFGPGMDEVRRSIRNKECNCPLANASYTNMIMSPRVLTRVSTNKFRYSRNGATEGSGRFRIRQDADQRYSSSLPRE
ncbi:MAG: SPASM domain-containing protein [Chloroflexi bacterium]|nr:SPASM domain-containing protein [Chloroflexota bacterium]